MDVLLTVGFLFTVLVAMGSGQSCPPVQNVAKVCSSSTYTGARVLMDTSYYTDSARNCTCTFSTTANTLRIVTYAAPNYQQCNSAIRLYSSSGNAMRFQCLMSGTYLDTSVHKEGGAEFQTYGPVYDKNYCLVLEHLGTIADSITISCNKNEDIHKSVNLDGTTSADQTVTTTTYPDATSTSSISTNADISTTTTDSLLTLSNNNLDLNLSNNNMAFNPKENETGQISQVTELTTSSELKISHFQDTTNETSSEKATISIAVGNTVKESSKRRDIDTLILKNSPRDIITFDKIARENEESTTESFTMIVESNDTAKNDMVTVTSDLRRFGSDVIANENQTLLPNFDIAFGNDAVRKDTVTLNPAVVTTVDPITFGNDIVLKDSTNEPPLNEIRDLLLQNGSVHSNDGGKSISNEQIFGNDAVTRIYTNVQSTVVDTRTFRSDVVENKTIDRNLDKTFGNEGIRRDAGTSNSVVFTTEKMVAFGDDAIHKGVSTKITLQEGTRDPSLQNRLVIEKTHSEATSGRHNFGSDAFRTHNSPTSTSYPKTFGSDVTFGGNQNFDISFDNVALRGDTVTSSSSDITSEKIAMIENDTFSNEIITDKQYTGTKHSNAMSDNANLSTDAITHTATYIQTTSFDLQTLAPNLVVDENKTFVKDISVSFGNDAIRNENVTTPSKDRVTFGNKPIVKDVLNIENNTYESMYLNINNNSNKESLERSNGENLTMTSDIRPTVRVDTVHGENHTFGPDIALKERATFGNDAIRPVPTVPEPTTPLRQNFGADAVSKQRPLSTNANRDSANLLLHDIANERINSSLSFITTNEIQTFGFDVIPKDKTDDFQNEKHTFGSDITSKEQTTFGRDDIPPVSKISEPTTQTRQSFGADAVTKQTASSFNLNRGNANLLPGDTTSERTTLYPYISTTNTRQTFGFDAIPKDRVVGFHGEKQTFGPDIAPKERSTFGSDAMPPVPMVPETTTQRRQSFGADAVTKQNSLLSNSNKEWANFLPGELIIEKSTSNPFADTTSKGQTFGFDGIPKDRIDRFPGEQHTFGPDIASKERTTFGNDAIRPVSTVSEATTPIRQRFGADAVTKQNSLSVNANKEKINILLGDITKERIVTDSLVDTTNIRQTFGFDAVPKETTTYGSVFLNKDGANMFNTVGKNIITTQQPRTTAAVASFWPDEKNATLMDILKNETLSFANGTNVTTETNITTETLQSKVLLGNDAILKDDELLVTSTSSPNKFWLDSDRVKQIPLETIAPLSTAGSQTIKDSLNSLQSEVLTPEQRATFGNDVILKETLAKTSTILTSTEPPFVTTELRAIFGPDFQRENVALMEGQRNVSSFSDDTRHSVLSFDDTQDFRNDTSAELLVFDGLSILNSTSVAVNSTNNQKSTFGSDAIGKELFTDSPILNNESKIDFGKSVVLRETLDSVKVIENTSALAKEGLIELPRISLGNDVLKKEDLLPKSSVSPDITQINHASLLNNVSPSRVHELLGSTAQTLDLDITTRTVPLENNVIAERPIAPLSHLNTEVSATFGHDAISGELSTVSTSIQSDDQSTREIFGDFKLRRQLLTTTESVNVATATHDNVGPVANEMDNNNFETVVETVQNDVISMENTSFETNVSRTNSVISRDDKFMVSADFTTTTMQSEVSDTISKQKDSSLLSSINEIRPDVLNTLVGSILKTHSETVSNINGNILRVLSGNNEDITTSTEMSTMPSDVILNDVQSSTDFIARSGEVLIPGDVVSTSKEGLPVTTAMDGLTMISEAAASNEKDVTNKEVPTIQVSTVVEKDVSATTKTTPDFLESTSSITTDATTSSERPMMKTTKIKSTSTQSTLPPIIPGQQGAFKPTVPIIRRMSTTDARTSTESTHRTTKKIYHVMVGEPSVTDDRNIVDGSSNIRSSKDQLNVSLDDENERPFFNMNNKTYIIVVIAVAGFIVLVAVISVIICNKRKSRSAKADITNGVTATSISHNNAVYDNDVLDAERGNVPAASNGVDTAKPVEVIEPQVNGSDNNLSGNL